MLDILNMIFSMTYYLELHNAISFIIGVFFTKYNYTEYDILCLITFRMTLLMNEFTKYCHG